ncbi:uncharacterized protein VTP21DRAFT_5228 [Calcarisporiella thermophila]|uniref:uncharacterized protein n=1 Tax=Calcarisporiella thermophila TaxID=911321 RepID=UPI0037420D9C
MYKEKTDTSSKSTESQFENHVAELLVDATLEEERRLVRKLDLRLIPFLALLYLLSFLDRINLGNAKLDTIESDLNTTGAEFNWALSIFFIGYILFEVPSNVFLKIVGPRRWLPLVMIAWGTVMMAMSAVQNATGLLIARFFLGVTESGLFPGIIFYLSLWYTRNEQTIRISLFFAAATISGAFGGVLAYGIIQMAGIQGLKGWQWIFILEGLPTILVAIVSYFYLPDFPENSRFLNAREKLLCVSRLKKDGRQEGKVKFSWHQFFMVLKDWKIPMHMLIYITTSIPLYSLSLFLPSIINQLGFKDKLTAQLMSAPPYVIACLFCVLTAISADRNCERGLHVAIPSLVGCIGYILLVALQPYGAVSLYIATIITTTGVFSTVPAMLSWFTCNIGGQTKRAVASAAIIAFGNIGGAIGGQIYREDDKASGYIRGHIICMSCLFVAFIACCLFKWLLIRENGRRDRLTPEEYAREAAGEDLCDWHPDFRYIS